MVLLLAGCGGADELGGECDRADNDACAEDLICTADAAGVDRCLLPFGAECDLDDEQPWCAGEGRCFEEGDKSVCRVGEGGACDPTAAERQCAEEFACEQIEGGAKPNGCFHPIVLIGDVFDAASLAVIEGAHVIALNEERFAVSDVAITDATGHYELRAPAKRNAEGAPTADVIYTLRAEAADYQPFPSGVRTALPINVASTAVEEETRYAIDIPLTDVALIALPIDQRGGGRISGQVTATNGRGAGVLVVAEGPAVQSSISDRSGVFTVFNLQPGSYTVRGYAVGVQLDPQTVEVAAVPVEGVVLPESDRPLSSISGSLQMVDGVGDLKTTVVLVVASTLQQSFVQGDVPPGLRAPRSGAPSIDGSWTIADVPDGDYYVLAGFENDLLVRDPDPNIAGTQIVRVTVPDPAQGSSIDLADSFKITKALSVISPGADAPETVGAQPTFRWADDSSEDYYQLTVYDAFGNEVWRVDQVDAVSGSADVSVTYGGDALMSGMYYQFRATSIRSPGPNATRAGPISTTEDLRGVFVVQP
jgi:hypothetical protein